LERRVHDMEKRAATSQMQPLADVRHASFGEDLLYAESDMGDAPVLDQQDPSNLGAAPAFPQEPQINPLLQESGPSFVGELKTLSLEATAERHLGSTSGISFARLTQMVLRRLTPDRADFVFINDRENYSGSRLLDFNSPSDLLDPALFESLNESISTHPALFGDIGLADISEPNDAVADLNLPSDHPHINFLVDFYFAHSNTLYPILHRDEFLESLRQVRENPLDPTAHSPLCLFRIWMVLAIGSTAYSSIALSDESESRVFYSKALEYLEQAFAYGDMVRGIKIPICNPRLLTRASQATLEVIMLQVSFSFFNQLGPSR
jgi:hypothetical protein